MSGAEAAVIAPMMAEVLGPGLAGAGMGAAGTGAAAAAAPAALGAAGAAAAPSIMSGLYGMLPGIGSQQAAMLAAQTGEFGLPGIMATGNAAASTAGPLAQSLYGAGSQLTGPLGAKIGNAADLGLKGMKTMQAAQALGQPQGVPQRRSIQLAPMAQGPMPAAKVPNPIEMAAWRRQQQAKSRLV